MPLILGAQSATAAGFSIDNSCRFNGVNGFLTRTNPGTSPTLATKGTLSWWMKRCGAMRDYTKGYTIYTHGAVAPYFQLAFNAASSDCPAKLTVENNDNGVGSSKFLTSAAYGDGSAWYHFCFTFDSTPATPDSTSVKLFVNGVQVTDFDTEVYPAQNDVFEPTVASSNYPIGSITTNFLEAYMAEIIQVDGQALDADNFGEFNSDSPTIWQPIDVSGITVGNNGFYLDFSDSANLGTLASGTGNFTETNIDATDQATDSPTNNFCVMNPLDNYYQDHVFTEGNCKVVTHASKQNYTTATIGLTAGKWYWEVEYDAISGGADWAMIGIAGLHVTSTSEQELGEHAQTWAYGAYYGRVYNDGGYISYGDAYAVGSIIGIALDLDNNKLYFAKDGVWQNSGDPTSGATGTGAVSITDPSDVNSGCYFPAISDFTGSQTVTFLNNFGGCSAFTVSSANQDGNGYGNFEYAPPSGYLAICTKNLGSDGG